MKPFTLYAADTPSRATHVRWMLEECGADYDIVALDFESGIKSPDYLAVNPMGKVPALKHQGEVFTETAAILTHLADLFPDKQLIPPVGTPERGQYYRWLLFGTHMEYAVIDRWLGTSEHPRRRTVCGYGDFDAALDSLRRLLDGREYAVGKQFSALDIYLSGLLAWGIMVAQTLPAEPVFTGYMNRHLARPAFARAQA